MLRRLLMGRRRWSWPHTTTKAAATAAPTTTTVATCDPHMLAQHLNSPRLPMGPHPLLAPASLLRFANARLAESVPPRTSLGELFDAAVREGQIPPDTALDTFFSCIAALHPVALDIAEPAITQKVELTSLPLLGQTPKAAWLRSLTVSRQPWVPPPAREYGTGSSSSSPSSRPLGLSRERDGVHEVVRRVVPPFFVSVEAVRAVMEAANDAAHVDALRWSDVASAGEGAGSLLEWTEDKRAVRVVCSAALAAPYTRATPHLRHHHHHRYRLLPHHPDTYHAALALVASVVPTHFTPVTGNTVAHLFALHQKNVCASPFLFSRFPNVESLLSHPDVWPCVEFAERATLNPVPVTNAAAAGASYPELSFPHLVVRLRKDFSHPQRGLADVLLGAACPAMLPSPPLDVLPLTIIPFTERMAVLTDMVRTTGTDRPLVAAVGFDRQDATSPGGICAIRISVAVVGVDSPLSVRCLTCSVEQQQDNPVELHRASLPEPLADFLTSDRIWKVFVNGERVGANSGVEIGGLSSGASTGTLAALCQYLGVPVGEALLLRPTLSSTLCAELGIDVGDSNDHLFPVCVAKTAVVARSLLLRYGEGNHALPQWKGFLRLTADQRSDHAYSVRLQRYFPANRDVKESGEPVWARTLADKRALLAELVLRYGAEKMPTAGVRRHARTIEAPKSEGSVEAALTSANLNNGPPLAADASTLPELADYNAMKELLEEAGRLRSRSVAADTGAATNSTEDAAGSLDNDVVGFLLPETPTQMAAMPGGAKPPLSPSATTTATTTTTTAIAPSPAQQRRQWEAEGGTATAPTHLPAEETAAPCEKDEDVFLARLLGGNPAAVSSPPPPPPPSHHRPNRPSSAYDSSSCSSSRAAGTDPCGDLPRSYVVGSLPPPPSRHANRSLEAEVFCPDDVHDHLQRGGGGGGWPPGDRRDCSRVWHAGTHHHSGVWPLPATAREEKQRPPARGGSFWIPKPSSGQRTSGAGPRYRREGRGTTRRPLLPVVNTSPFSLTAPDHKGNDGGDHPLPERWSVGPHHTSKPQLYPGHEAYPTTTTTQPSSSSQKREHAHHRHHQQQDHSPWTHPPQATTAAADALRSLLTSEEGRSLVKDLLSSNE